jgi:hypothetical protein
MKKNYILSAVLALAVSAGFAQTVDIDDDMESYTLGEEIFNDWWTDWSGSGTYDGMVSTDAYANSGTQSGFAGDDPNNDDPVLGLGGKIFGTWYTSFYYYIPSDKEGYFNLQGNDPVNGAGEWIVGNINFNDGLLAPGEGLIDNSALGVVSFNFPHDQWFEVAMVFDISGGLSVATWSMHVDGVEVIPAGTAFTDSVGTVPTSLGGINFYAVSANHEAYVDDVRHADFPESTVGIQDFNQYGFQAYPNPVNNVLNLQANENISKVAIYNVLGQEVYSAKINAMTSSVDMSSMASGAYFVKVNINGTEGTVKVIK